MDTSEAIYVPSSQDGALRQGEIVSDLVQVRIALPSLIAGTEAEIDRVKHPFAVVMSQDCDLDWDYRARQPGGPEGKMVPNVLFCEVVEASVLRGSVNAGIWGRIRQNKDERYQFLERVPADADAEGRGLPELGIDFKRYFTLPSDEVYERLRTMARRRCRLQSPYLEHLTTRFGYYQVRVALPADHFSE